LFGGGWFGWVEWFGWVGWFGWIFESYLIIRVRNGGYFGRASSRESKTDINVGIISGPMLGYHMKVYWDSVFDRGVLEEIFCEGAKLWVAKFRGPKSMRYVGGLEAEGKMLVYHGLLWSHLVDVL
jgi:hypothetical protein